ncbi:MAG: UDP-N-acetylmuramoyl-tripeptide--D-alanyl-D-alanine ligase [Gammaproteobacteria bacterium]
MMLRTLSAVANEVNGTLVGADAPFGPVSTDSRRLIPGALFVAIAGDRFDGNDFVADAHAKGAAGALVSRRASSSLRQIEVRDTRRALGLMAKAWRTTFAMPTVVVAGSSGKTIVKELVASILGVSRSICVTQGNMNNDIGVPLTLLMLTDEHDALVVELGASRAGEIDYLANLAQPTVAVITNAAPGHLRGFGSVAGVAAGKGELLDHLPRAGTAVLNADDPFRGDWFARAPCEDRVTFGFSPGADCRVIGEPTYGAAGSEFTLQLPDGDEVDVWLPLPGRHNVVNAMAAAAAAQAAGASAEDIGDGLAHAVAVPEAVAC